MAAAIGPLQMDTEYYVRMFADVQHIKLRMACTKMAPIKTIIRWLNISYVNIVENRIYIGLTSV